MPDTPGRPSRIRRIAPVAALVVLLALATAGTVYRHTLVRLVRTLTLFEPDRIAANFRTMGDAFDARIVHRGPQSWPFRYAPRPLPATYTFRGETRDLAAFLERTGTTGLVVARDDTIHYEDYRQGNTAASKAIAWSVTKSFVSALFGIAVAEGLVTDIHRPVTDYVPSLRGSGYDGVPIKDVLQMSSGIGFDEDYGDFGSDINRLGRAFACNAPLGEFVAGLQRERPPGTFHHYVSMDTQVLGMVLREVTGRPLAEFLEDRLWKPLGMESDALWLIDGAGMEAAFGGLNAVLRDWVRFGRLYLHGGEWNGRQIIPADWVRASVTPDAPHLQPGARVTSTWVLGYGYQWWLPEAPEGDYLAIGVYGQFLYVHPGRGIVIARSSAYADYNIDGDDMELETIAAFRAIAQAMDGGPS
jgi:CubicO group peptidase (beta-lactamase class C family)